MQGERFYSISKVPTSVTLPLSLVNIMSVMQPGKPYVTELTVPMYTYIHHTCLIQSRYTGFTRSKTQLKHKIIKLFIYLHRHKTGHLFSRDIDLSKKCTPDGFFR